MILSLSGILPDSLALICVLPNRKPPMSPQKVKTRQLQEEEPPEQKSSWLTTFFFPEGTFDNPEVKKMYKSGLVAVALFLIAGMGMKKVSWNQKDAAINFMSMGSMHNIKM